MIAKDYYYKGGSCGVVRTDAFTSYDFVDSKDIDTHIRIVGSKKEIDVLNKEFMSENKHLYLDEVYSYEVPKKGSYWYKHCCYGTPQQYKDKMKIIKSNLMLYKEKYKKGGAFIV